jgi:hypothetical protein
MIPVWPWSRRLCLHVFPPQARCLRLYAKWQWLRMRLGSCQDVLNGYATPLLVTIDRQPTSPSARACWAAHHEALVRHQNFGSDHQDGELDTKTAKVLVLKRFNGSLLPKTHHRQFLRSRLLHGAGCEPHSVPERLGTTAKTISGIRYRVRPCFLAGGKRLRVVRRRCWHQHGFMVARSRRRYPGLQHDTHPTPTPVRRLQPLSAAAAISTGYSRWIYGAMGQAAKLEWIRIR